MKLKNHLLLFLILWNLNLYSQNIANHIDFNNVEKLEELELSKTKDGFLKVASLGTITTVSILPKVSLDAPPIFQKDSFEDIKVDLSDFDVGEYTLWITSCHTGGILKLKIVK